MPVGGCHLYSGDYQKTVHREAISAHKAFFEHVGYGLACVVIRHCKPMQSLAPGRGNQFLRAANPVSREERVSMKIDVVGHSQKGTV